MWQWWNAVRKADPDFQWKTPIEFFGQIVDQTNVPVVDAEIRCGWTSIPGEPTERQLRSDSNGRFELRGVRGKVLTVRVAKDGYVSGEKGQGGFEFAAFFEPNFHIPDPTTPVIFRLWKLGDSEPMYFWYRGDDLTADGTRQWFDVATGRKGGRDLAFSVTRSNQTGPTQFDYTLMVEAPGGLVLTNDELMFKAPAGIYTQSLKITQKHGTPGYEQSQSLRFYLRTFDGKFAAIKAKVSHFTVPGAQVQLAIYYNPSGSRNLEYDYRKQINK
jgi:hypothetical protein